MLKAIIFYKNPIVQKKPKKAEWTKHRNSWKSVVTNCILDTKFGSLLFSRIFEIIRPADLKTAVMLASKHVYLWNHTCRNIYFDGHLSWFMLQVQLWLHFLLFICKNGKATENIFFQKQERIFSFHLMWIQFHWHIRQFISQNLLSANSDKMYKH